MRYWHTDMNKKRVWVTSDNKTPLAIINDYYHDKCYVWDADQCGDEKVYFVFSNGQKYVLEYEWYIGPHYGADRSMLEDGDDGWGVHCNHTIEETTDNFDYPADRDWIDL